MSSFHFKARCDKPAALVIMFHGVGSNPKSLHKLATYLHQQCPDLEISIPTGFSKSPLSPKGFHWFGIEGVTETDRLSRVMAVMTPFDQLIREQAEVADVPLNKVVLAGFSQGTIMSLEWFKQTKDQVAGIVAMAGRFAELPVNPTLTKTPVCLIHGELDEISDPVHAQQSYDALLKLGTPVELNLIADAPHRVTESMYPLVADFIQRLSSKGKL